MIRCTKCGHQNLPSYPTCGKCGAPLAGAAEAQAQDEYRQLAVERAAKARRTRIVYMGFGLVALGVIGAWMVKDSQNKGKVQEKLDYAERWVSLEKKETGLFWNCVLASEVDVGLFANAGQIQQRIEAAYATQQKTFSEHLLTECVPRMERARQAFAGLPEPPAELKGAAGGVQEEPAGPAGRRPGLRRTDQEPRRQQGRRPADPGDGSGLAQRGLADTRRPSPTTSSCAVRSRGWTR